MFISSDDKDNRLSNYAENVEVHFAFKKKTEILAKARNLLLECDFSIPQVSFWTGKIFLLLLVFVIVDEEFAAGVYKGWFYLEEWWNFWSFIQPRGWFAFHIREVFGIQSSQTIDGTNSSDTAGRYTIQNNEYLLIDSIQHILFEIQGSIFFRYLGIKTI